MTVDDDTIDGDSSRNPLELLADEFSAAQRSGAKPSIEEFVKRLPDRQDEARALLQSIALFERVSQQEFTRHAAHRRQHRFVQKQHEQLGDYRIVREIGRGGMGVIYEAEQITLKRRVALKVLSTASSESVKQLERFQREAEAIARLHHTNIVPVFGSGSQDGVHYFAMQLIDGQPLSQLPDMNYQQIGRLGMQAASALAYAHSHGVLHRDIKPSNLLLDKAGEVWVTDFGLAKLTDVGELTQTGDVMGTLKYMAPEQLEGKADERTDIYSLGLTLYELVTRQPAFDISKSLVNRIRNHEFPAPRSIKSDIPRDLETIILKATASEPRHRYSSASDLADDLRCFVEDRPIAARRASSIERLGRWMRRNPALASSLVATSLLLVATSIVTSLGYYTTREALQAAQKAREQADDARSGAVESQQRAENNLNVALQAFDAIFDNVAQRGVPQSLTLDMQQAADASDATGADGQASSVSKPDVPKFEVTLNSADAELLNNLLKFYSKFAEQNGEDDALRMRTAQAYRRIGQIQLRLGSSDQALQSYASAKDLLEKLGQEHPGEIQYGLASAEVLNDLGFALSSISKDVREIVDCHKQAIARLESQSSDDQQLPNVRLELARAYDLAGSILGRSGTLSLEDMGPPMGGLPFGGWMRFGMNRPGPRPDGPRPDGREFGPRGNDPRRPNGPGSGPPGTGPSNGPSNGPPRGRGPFGLPSLADLAGGPSKMLQSMIDQDLLRARDLLAGLNKEFPDNQSYLLAYAASQRHLMMHFMSTDRMSEATKAFTAARQSLSTLLERQPNDPKVLLELADTLSTASARLTGLDAAESEDYLRQSTTTCQQLCETFPSVPEYQALLANCQDKLGRIEQQKSHWPQADQAFLQAIERLVRLRERFPDNRFYQFSLLQAATHFAELRLMPEAERNDSEALAVAREYLKSAINPYKAGFGRVSKSAIDQAERALGRL